MTSSQAQTVPFYKMQGSGNDFILFDNRSLRLPISSMQRWAQKLCARAFSIGSDGLIFIDHPPVGSSLDYIWHFYNADGSRAEMCGNGSRCVAKLAYKLGIAGESQTFGTDAGPIRATILPEINEVKVQLTKPSEEQLHLTITKDSGEEMDVHFINTGVPHAVLFANDVKKVDVAQMGKSIRYNTQFAPAGTNVNFVQIQDREHILLRTYERGVENETYACGTGASASVYIAHALGKCSEHVAVTTTGGESLTVHLENSDVFLQGHAQLVYTGHFQPQALGLEIPE